MTGDPVQLRKSSGWTVAGVLPFVLLPPQEMRWNDPVDWAAAGKEKCHRAALRLTSEIKEMQL
jgi:hypothetical protein